MALQVTWAAAILSTLVQSNCEYTLKPPFRDNICNDQTRKSPLSGIFEKFATGHEDEISLVYDDYADCVSDDFVSDYGGRHKDEEWDEESVIDQAFFSLFDDLSMVPDSMHISCANSHTIEYSMDMSARMKGIDKPFGYKMRFQLEYNDDGLIQKVSDQTPFHRNVVRNFYTLMDGDIGDDSSDSSDRNGRGDDDHKFGEDGGITPRYRPPPGYERTYDGKKVEDNLDNSDCKYTLKPPFRDNVCKDQTRESPLSLIFEKFATGQEDQISMYDDYADCVSDDFVSDFGGRHKEGESGWDEESVIDQAFLSLFDDLSMVPDSMRIRCVNSYTIEYSMDMSARMKGIDKPFGYKMRFQLEYDDDGLIKKMSDQTPFHRNVLRNFYTLMDGDIGGGSDSANGGKNGRGDGKFDEYGGITPRVRHPYDRTYDDKKVEDNLDDHKEDVEKSEDRNRDKKAVCQHYDDDDMEICHEDCEMEDMGCGHCTLLDNWCGREYKKRQPRFDDDGGMITPRYFNYRPPPGYERTYDDKKVADNLDNLDRRERREEQRKKVCGTWTATSADACYANCKLGDNGCDECSIMDTYCGKEVSTGDIGNIMNQDTQRFMVNHPRVPLDMEQENSDMNSAKTVGIAQDPIVNSPNEQLVVAITAPMIFVGVLAIVMAAMIVVCIGFMVRRDVAPVSPAIVNYGKDTPP